MISKERFLRALVLNLVLLLMPIGDIFFLIPAQITSGGLYGVAIILMHVFGFKNIEVIPVIALIFNIPLLIYSYKYFSKKYFDMTFYATAIFPLYMWLMVKLVRYMGITVSKSSIYVSTFWGSLIPGIGVGIIMGLGGSTGGTDIIAKIINQYFPKISIGTGVSISNLIITLVTAIIFGIDRGIASIASIVLTGWFIDLTLLAVFRKNQGDLE